VSKAGREIVNLDADKARALALTPVSRETEQRLEKFIEALFLWQKTVNLVASSTLQKIWTRHIADSLQLADFAPKDITTWVDLGSGAGFPAIPIACAFADRPSIQLHLVESNAKRAAFLREAIRVTGVSARVYEERAESFVERFGHPVEVVSARALSSLKNLCDQAYPLIAKGAIGLFPKGQDVVAELTEATKYWNIERSIVPSKTDTRGRIVIVYKLKFLRSH
jgi:16S rRNA (guanine527-N7)-methyltransferase